MRVRSTERQLRSHTEYPAPPEPALGLWSTVVLVGMAATLPLRDVAVVTAGTANVRPGDLFLVLGMLWLAKAALGREPLGLRGSVSLALCAFVAYSTFTLLWTPELALGAARDAKLIRNLAVYAIILAHARRSLLQTLGRFVSGALISVGYLAVTMGQAARHAKINWAQFAGMRVLSSGMLSEWRDAGIGGGTFGAGTINALAMWLAVVLFLLVGVPSVGRRLVLRAVAVAVLLLMLIATFSRGVWLATGVAAATYWFLSVPRRVRRTTFMHFAVLGSALLVLWTARDSMPVRLIAGRLGSAGADVRDAAVSERIKLWIAGGTVLAADPVFGVGAGGVGLAVGAVSEYQKSFLHNLYVQIAVEFGVIGLGGLLVAIVAAVLALRAGFAKNFAHEDAVWRASQAAISAAGVVCLVEGLTGLDLGEMECWIVLAFAQACAPLAWHRTSGADLNVRR